MKKIVHISDLHFGRENPQLIPLLLEDINFLNPDLVVISGDFTQRATKKQFIAANKFISSIPYKLLCVPGNHDISLFNLWRRFACTYHRYHKYIYPFLSVSLQEPHLMILGINSTTPFKGKNGYISPNDLSQIKSFFAKALPGTTKILIMHHNLIRIAGSHTPIANNESVIFQLLQAKVDIVLSGHLHIPYIEEITAGNKQAQHKMYLITSGTTMSTRLKGLTNSYNFLELTKDGFSLEIRSLSDNKYVGSEKRKFLFY